MTDLMLWIVTGLSIAGTVLNVRRVRFCFVLWGLTNVFWVVRNLRIGEIQQALLFLVYLVFAVWGWFSWGTQADGKPASNRQQSN